jgi:VanZ family protein
MRKSGFYWLPALIWMAVIFAASSDRQSAEHSSRLIGPLIHWLFPSIPDADVDEVVFLTRKVAHVTEYAVLAVLIWLARRQPFGGNPRPWDRRHAWFAWFGCVLYAVTDEFHQLFVPTREGTVHDVVIDSCGAALGLLIVWAVGRWGRRR